jgi:hypothetical protein
MAAIDDDGSDDGLPVLHGCTSDGHGAHRAGEVRSHDQAHISATVGGYVTVAAGVQLPDPNVLLDPGFEWPDVPMPVVGWATYRTGAEAWQSLDSTVVVFDGTVNIGTRRLQIESRDARARVPVPVS